MTNDKQARKDEIARFLGKYPNAETTQVVDHMMEKFEGTKRHQHRAMIGRFRKAQEALTIEPEFEAKTKNGTEQLDEALNGPFRSGRTSSKQPNPSNLPQKPLMAQTVKALREKCAEMGLSVKGTKTELAARIAAPPVPVDEDIDIAAAAPSAPPEKPKRMKVPKKPGKRGRKAGDWPKVKFSETKKRRSYVHEYVLSNPEAKRAAIVENVHNVFEGISEEATHAMVQVVRLAIKHGQPVKQRFARHDAATCPVCKKTVKGEDEIQREFGFRCDYERRQSNCRACRKKKLQDAKKQKAEG